MCARWKAGGGVGNQLNVARQRPSACPARVATRLPLVRLESGGEYATRRREMEGEVREGQKGTGERLGSGEPLPRWCVWRVWCKVMVRRHFTFLPPLSAQRHFDRSLLPCPWLSARWRSGGVCHSRRCRTSECRVVPSRGKRRQTSHAHTGETRLLIGKRAQIESAEACRREMARPAPARLSPHASFESINSARALPARRCSDCSRQARRQACAVHAIYAATRAFSATPAPTRMPRRAW